MSAGAAKRKTLERVIELRRVLLAEFEVFGRCVPLRIGIHAEAIPWAKARGYKPFEVNMVLRHHTRSLAYQVFLARGGPRYTLTGEVSGEVSEEHRQAACDVVEAAAKARKEMQKARKSKRKPKPRKEEAPVHKSPARPVITLRKRRKIPEQATA